MLGFCVHDQNDCLAMPKIFLKIYLSLFFPFGGDTPVFAHDSTDITVFLR